MQSIIIKNENGQSIAFKNSAPYILETVEGTETPTSSFITTKSPSQDGRSLHGMSLDERTIILYGGIVGYSIDDMYLKRQELCKILNPRFKNRLIYINNSSTHEIDCVIEDISFETKVSNIQRFMIQIYCPDPFWNDINEFKEEIALWVGDFEFPLEIFETGIEMGHRVSNLIANIYNKGDVECGMRIEFTALANVVSPSLFNIHTREFIKIKRTLEAGNKLVITTSFANKRVEIIRKGVLENAFHYIDLDSTFLQLDAGDNLLRYDAEIGIDNLEVSIYYTPRYLGA